MDAPGDSADPDGDVAPPAAFYGLWPKFAEQEQAQVEGTWIVGFRSPAGSRD